ncbi:MAG: hypothetical protein SAK42_14760, partial [Oscillatoria sp. PMC 1076.18]|nr:hypothetical protein [Oscillatoria sp. PMC 1076.18]
MMTVELNEIQWEVAHKMAENLASDKVDVNELKKVIAYLRFSQNKEKEKEKNTPKDKEVEDNKLKNDVGKNFFEYLRTLARNGDKIGHSGKTIEYYRSIEAICRKHLRGYQDDVEMMLQILGWTSRLVKYKDYESKPEGESKISSENSNIHNKIAPRKAKVAEVVAKMDFAVGQTVEAEITSIKGNQVTYQMSIPHSQKEPKLYN